MSPRPCAAACAAVLATCANAARAQEIPATTLDRISVTASRPSTLPIEIPTSVESITGEQVERRINATDAEDALKYFPSLSVRKRYIGDYDHAVLATRASGTGNSARSLVYADGILLSNLLGNGAGFTPRWALVTPEEIERVDVLYGPFSAAYSGNSAGAIVDYVTRMPTRLEAHVKAQAFTQHYRLYATDDRYSGGEGSASIGSRAGAFAWWVDVNRLVSDAQPVSFVVKNVPAATSVAGTPVSGAVLDRNPRNVPGYVLGTTTQTDTRQDHAKLKLAYDATPTLRATYTLGYWKNDADRGVDSFLRNGAGGVVTSGATPQTVNIDGRAYTVLPTDFARSTADMEHVMHGLTVKSHTRGVFDWEAVASVYDFSKDLVRAQVPNVAAPNAGANAGRITDQHGTGWNTSALKGVWRPGRGDDAAREAQPSPSPSPSAPTLASPDAAGSEASKDIAANAIDTHVVEFGVQRDAFTLKTLVSDTPDWHAGDAGPRFSAFSGRTSLASVWTQDAWAFAPAWKTVLGARLEQWRAEDGRLSNATTTLAFQPRRETDLSPKAAISWQASRVWLVSASLGRAVRMPTVTELFQGSISANDIVNNDPLLKPEKSWTGELSAERDLGFGSVRGTLFAERTADALYSQVDVTAGGTVATIQNIDRVRTSGVELAYRLENALLPGLDLDGSLTYADSRITRNDRFPASVGRWQPRVPPWRASAIASYAFDSKWSGSVGFRYAGREYGQLDNSDPNGYAFTGFSRFFVVDVRAQYRVNRSWSASAGIDNLNNDRYWAFHPYPQRTFHAELRYDL